MARETLFEPKSVSFEYVADVGGYVFQTTPAPFTLTVGETYVIVWEGQEYTRTAFAADGFAPGAVGVGNASFIGGNPDPDNLPVVVGYLADTDYVAFLTAAGAGEHSVGLYKAVSDRETIFEPQEISGFEYVEGVGYFAQTTPAPFTLTVGETYVIELDGREYTRTAYAFDSFEPGTIALGTDYPVTGIPDPDGLAIIVGYNSVTNYVGFVAMTAVDSLTLGIYKESEEAVYYTVSSLSLKAIGNAIREKTGSSNALSFPDGMVQAIKEITGSGGGSGNYTDAVYTVTFMNGSEVLYARAVADGDNCADVVSRGLVPTPTKESTAQYDFTHNGWSLTDGGSADSSALSNVTEDRTVYAAYSNAVKYYTVTYYDSDGVTVLNTESLAYGAIPKYRPTKDDYILAGWEPALTAVTGDISYTAVWEAGLSFATMSWSEIDAAVKAGKAHYFKLGERKTFSKGTKTFYVRIAGINHDDLADGSGKAGLTLIFEEPSYANYWHNSGTTARNQINWIDSYAYTDNNGAYYYYKQNLFPTDFTSVLKTVTKTYYDCVTSTYITADVQFFMPALVEITGANIRPEEGSVYEYYADGYAGKIGYYANGVWTRTKTSSTSGQVYYAKNDGTYTSASQGLTSNPPENPQMVCI